MKKLLLCSMLFVALMLSGSKLFAQRYVNDIFSAVNRTTNVVYDSNRAVNIIPPSNPPIVTQNLICDIYQPAGDSLCKRPLVILLHTGSYLPTIANRQTTGSKNDSNVVELANRFAKKGYVVVAMNYRLGWNPATTIQEVAAEQLIKATYRAIQDVRNCVRFMRTNATTYRIDTSKIIVGGQGTGGYVALALGTVNKRSEIESNPKFLRGSDGTPMVSVDTLGDWNGLGGVPFFNYSGDSAVSGNVHMVFNFGGAIGDSAWLESNSLPVVSLHCVKDPFAPYKTGNVVVPTTGLVVIPNASGAGDVIPAANAKGVNNKINSRTYTDPISTRAAAFSGGVNNLYPFWTVTPEGSPWEWWDRAFVQSINFPSPGAGRQADSLSMLTNPFMSAARGRAYCDTIVGFVNPRIVAQFDLDADGADSIVVGSLIGPANNASVSVTNDSTKNITISWSAACSYPGANLSYSWAITDTTADFSDPILEVPTGSSTSLTLTEKAVWDLLGSLGVPVGGTAKATWTVFANNGGTEAQYSTWNITLTRANTVGVMEVDNKAAFNVYPNPSNGIVNIASAQKVSAIRIIDLTGKSVVETNQTKIDVSALTKGIYFVEVTLENGAKSTKRLLVN